MRSCNLFKVCFGKVDPPRSRGRQSGFQGSEDAQDTDSTRQTSNRTASSSTQTCQARIDSGALPTFGETITLSQHENCPFDVDVVNVDLSWNKCTGGLVDASAILSDEQLVAVNTVSSKKFRSTCASVSCSEDHLTDVGDDVEIATCGSSSQEFDNAGLSGKQHEQSKLMSSKIVVAGAGFSSTTELVNAYNHSTEKREREALHAWLQAYVTWFTDTKDARVAAGAIDEYACLVRIMPREPRDKRLIRDVLSSLSARAEREPAGNRDSTVALSDALQAVDEDVFSEGLEILFGIATVLLFKLDPSKTVFIRETSGAHESTLLALHRVLFLIQLVAPHRLNPNQKGFYQTVKTRLDEICSQSTHFPITFQAETAKQTLQRLAQKESTYTLPVLKRCVKGFLYLYSGVRHVIVADINVDSWVGAYHELRQVYNSLRCTRKDWYGALMELNCTAHLVLKHAEAQRVFIKCFERLMKDQHELDSFLDRKFLAFGIVRQLQILAGNGPVLIRAKAIDEIIQLALTYTVCDPCYGDPMIVEALLDALLHIYTSGVCCNDAEKVLRTMIDDENKQIAVTKWLNGQTIDTKLQQEIADRLRRDNVADNENGLGQIHVVKIHWSKQSCPAFTADAFDNKGLDCAKVKIN